MSAFKCAKNISLNFILKCVIIIQELSSHENSLVYVRFNVYLFQRSLSLPSKEVDTPHGEPSSGEKAGEVGGR